MANMDAFVILLSDLRILRRFWWRLLVTSVASPLLYLVAFGWGLGRGIDVDGISYIEFVIPGIIAITAMTSSFNSAGMKLNVDRLFCKSFEECLMSPVNRFSIILGKSLIGVVRGLISSGAFLIVAYLISPTLSFSPLFALVLVLTCFLFAFMGVFAALLAKSHEDMAMFSSLTLLPMTFLAGTFFSLSTLPAWLKVIINFLPLTHCSLCLRAAALGQPFPWLSLLAILGFGLALLLGCTVVLRRSSI